MINTELEKEKMYQDVKKTIIAGCFLVTGALYNRGLNIESPSFASNSLFIVLGTGLFTILILLAEIWDYGRAFKR